MRDEHDILREVLAQRWFATTRTKEGDQLRGEDLKHGSKRIFVRRLQKILRGCALLKEFFTCDCLGRSCLR